MQVILSQHAKQRCSTRAIKNKHIELALQYGTITVSYTHLAGVMLNATGNSDLTSVAICSL